MHTSEHNPQPLYVQLYEQFKQMILRGAFAAGEKLPPIRKLCDERGVSRNTVEAAYRQLVSEGYVFSKPGSGYTVENLSLEELGLIAGIGQPASAARDYSRAQTQDFARSLSQKQGASCDASGAQTHSFAAKDHSCEYDFTYGNLEHDLFPAKLWQKLTTAALFGVEARNANCYNDHQGDYLLRQAIASNLLKNRGVSCSAHQVIIQSGTQAAAQSLAQLFDPAKDTIAFEDPGYDGVRQVFKNNRYRVVPCRAAQRSSDFFEDLAASGAQLVFVTPSNQFPTGRGMTTHERFALIEWAQINDAYVIEDDYCSEFRYDGRPSPAIQSLDITESVIYLGTFSKALSPALRISYMILPEHLHLRWQERFKGYYPTVPWLSQIVLRSFIEEGHWDRLVRKAKTRNKHKHDILVHTLKAFMGERIEVLHSGSGLHLLVRVKDGRSQDTLVEQAAKQGVRVYKTDAYWLGECPPQHNHILIGFSAIEEDRIVPGIECLYQAWFGGEARLRKHGLGNAAAAHPEARDNRGY